MLSDVTGLIINKETLLLFLHGVRFTNQHYLIASFIEIKLR